MIIYKYDILQHQDNYPPPQIQDRSQCQWAGRPVYFAGTLQRVSREAGGGGGRILSSASPGSSSRVSETERVKYLCSNEKYLIENYFQVQDRVWSVAGGWESSSDIVWCWVSSAQDERVQAGVVWHSRYRSSSWWCRGQWRHHLRVHGLAVPGRLQSQGWVLSWSSSSHLRTLPRVDGELSNNFHGNNLKYFLQAGIGLVMTRLWKTEVATLFTTHATQLGRWWNIFLRSTKLLFYLCQTSLCWRRWFLQQSWQVWLWCR